METVAVQYLGGCAEVYVPDAGVTALRGENGQPGPPVEVPATQAGTEPFVRPVEAGDDLTWMQSRTVETGDVDDDGNPVTVVMVLDPGSGLLAQVDSWRRADATGQEG